MWPGPWARTCQARVPLCASAAVPGVMSGHNHTTGELWGRRAEDGGAMATTLSLSSPLFLTAPARGNLPRSLHDPPRRPSPRLGDVVSSVDRDGLSTFSFGVPGWFCNGLAMALLWYWICAKTVRLVRFSMAILLPASCINRKLQTSTVVLTPFDSKPKVVLWFCPVTLFKFGPSIHEKLLRFKTYGWCYAMLLYSSWNTFITYNSLFKMVFFY